MGPNIVLNTFQLALQFWFGVKPKLLLTIFPIVEHANRAKCNR